MREDPDRAAPAGASRVQRGGRRGRLGPTLLWQDRPGGGRVALDALLGLAPFALFGAGLSMSGLPVPVRGVAMRIRSAGLGSTGRW